MTAPTTNLSRRCRYAKGEKVQEVLLLNKKNDITIPITENKLVFTKVTLKKKLKIRPSWQIPSNFIFVSGR